MPPERLREVLAVVFEQPVLGDAEVGLQDGQGGAEARQRKTRKAALFPPEVFAQKLVAPEASTNARVVVVDGQAAPRPAPATCKPKREKVVGHAREAQFFGCQVDQAEQKTRKADRAPLHFLDLNAGLGARAAGAPGKTPVPVRAFFLVHYLQRRARFWRRGSNYWIPLQRPLVCTAGLYFCQRISERTDGF